MEPVQPVGREATSDARRWYPFAFTPSTVPGFAEYKATYSHFRILKAKLYISRNVLNMEGSTNNYLVVGSRPFAAIASRERDSVSLCVCSATEGG